MNHNDQEIEVKFYLGNLPALEEKLRAAGAECVQPRVFERNLRFDLPDGSLTRQRRVLRLRSDRQAVLTYKSPALPGETVSIRQEIEVVVSDFEAAKRLLEALGYQVSVIYEKWRATYRLPDAEIVLDELPYGNFCEIEGTNSEAIQTLANQLGLDWSARILESYLALFERLKTKRQLALEHLSFAEVSSIPVTAADLDLRPADR